ncbi:nucleotidyltransferase family protein [Bordetella genomosp. 13]|uniref:MobA-like NTP transferase domain-containing protein n=1 Tax=Bordetella genomosp. 13 TaxID=463040 RepID=A0A1W6ZHU0_9BORD|nr:nucleotidyltransferase family protein [Bordetella genomosp. 13]ARP96872.1 hypothetical protein CAL15_22405 [Bordetella genomosp. 13]
MTMDGCIGILLAGGYGSRYAAESPGADKLLARLPDGRPVAVAAAQAMLEALPQALAVVRPESTALAALLSAEGCRVVPAVQARQGMGGSLAAAAIALMRDTPSSRHCLVALADMPWLRSATVAHVALHSRGHRIAAPVYEGQRGHPVAFAAELWPELAGLEGDEGARILLRRQGVHALPVDDPGVLADVDVPADLAAARTSPNGRRSPD